MLFGALQWSKSGLKGSKKSQIVGIIESNFLFL